jgi:DNA-binding response OmpR family regulator
MNYKIIFQLDFTIILYHIKYGGFMFKILLAEDDRNLRNALVQSIKSNGYEVIGAENGKEAFDKFLTEHFDLVVTDIMMPVMDGNELTCKIKNENPNTPILMLTALESIDDKEKGFGSGADDYLVKPFALKELLLRIKALLRRYESTFENKIELAHTKLDYNTFALEINGKEIELTKKEFLLLFKLLSNPNIIFSREQLMNEIWGYECSSFDRTVDTHIKVLREKVESPDFEIVTVRGLGYKARLK